MRIDTHKSAAILRCATVLAVTTFLGACAHTVSVRDTQVTHLSPSDIRDDPGRIAGIEYLSTGQPDLEILDAAEAAGYVAVIDLRGVAEDRGIDERAEVESRGLRYVSIPLSTPADATAAAAEQFADTLSTIDGPVLMHCASGNRVGALFAVRARAEGASAAEALRIGESAGLNQWRDAIESRLAEPEDR